MPYRMRRSELRKLTTKAVKLSNDLHEICGLLVDNGYFLQLVEVRNTCRRPCSFCLHGGDIRVVEKACDRLNSRVVGTFHSHIVSPAKPGKGDIDGASDGNLMLVLDTIHRDLGLWRIRGRRAYRLKLEII
jgi:proteasome lid subunit RPN8/RPN11